MELINRAYIYSGIVARDLDAVDGSEGRDGLFLLNQFLAEKCMTPDLIPYYDEITVNTTNGEANYFVEGLIDLATIAFDFDTVRFPMIEEKRGVFFGSARVNNIKSLPYHYFWERTLGGSTVRLYFIPNQNYPLKITGKFYLPTVTINTELDDIVDKYYQVYLMYGLAEYICIWNKITPNPKLAEKVKEFEEKLFDLNPVDYTIQKLSTFSKTASLTYAQANFGKGWTVGV